MQLLCCNRRCSVKQALPSHRIQDVHLAGKGNEGDSVGQTMPTTNLPHNLDTEQRVLHGGHEAFTSMLKTIVYVQVCCPWWHSSVAHREDHCRRK